MDWNDKIILTDEDKVTTLDAGEYDFKIKEFERALSQKGNPMAVLTLEVSDPLSHATVKDYIVLQENSKWKMIEFFESIGMKKPGQDFEVSWDNLVGKGGRCSVYIDSYESGGKTYQSNKIDSYLPPEDEFVF